MTVRQTPNFDQDPLATKDPVSPLPVLTTLRFIAAAEVVAFHYRPRVSSSFLNNLTANGYEAVAFFFVLSGFILTYVYTNGSAQGHLNTSTVRFWVARAARIAPVYVLSLVIAFPLYLHEGLLAREGAANHFVLGLVLVPLFLQAWWPSVALAWNRPAWSLSVEALFYAVFPAVIRATASLSPFRLLAISYASVAITSAFRGVMAGPPSVANDYQMFFAYFPLFHLPTFVLGVALARVHLSRSPAPGAISGLFFWGGSAALLTLFGFRDLFPWWTRADAVLVPLFGLIILGAARYQRGVLCNRTFLLFGEASYSMYLLHDSLRFWWNYLLGFVFDTSSKSVTQFVLYFSATLLASVIAFLWFEKPLRRALLSRSLPLLRVSLAAPDNQASLAGREVR